MSWRSPPCGRQGRLPSRAAATGCLRSRARRYPGKPQAMRRSTAIRKSRPFRVICRPIPSPCSTAPPPSVALPVRPQTPAIFASCASVRRPSITTAKASLHCPTSALTGRSKHRRPATFRLDDSNVVVVDADEVSRPVPGTVQITRDAEPQLPATIESPAVRRRGFGWGRLFWTAVAGLVLLGLGLGTVNLIEDLFARSESLGVLGIALTAVAALALGVITLRELTALVRLATIEKLHAR